MTSYEQYLADMKRLKASKPWMSEEQFNETWGIKAEREQPEFIARKSGSEKCVEPTFSNYEKRISRKGWSADKIAARKAENVRRYREKKREANSRGSVLSTAQ